ncbi:alpha-ketoglutarate-dependent dioxygenase AlkB [Thalassotalea sp. LPB0316]|uniref:alpha-ketoglutarate-dependent dioxygenase AlkB family protein n=1 Tax=Thalassotalea sp. LPB0316 TaxID=2769490 RepID=UPI001865C82E|nr:alpha-ketoglutarate-dependent dioxygenase AlkB [Thalassotalea sp. LPB0316]QOL26995.1 alpha-ketoglutarate-dependent dioxygenase AlkB [Thalassotalea sp. LPB0316]
MKIPAPNASLDYLPHFISLSRARALEKRLKDEIAFSQDKISLYGKAYDIPRLQAWFGDASYTYSGLKMNPQPWTPALLEIKHMVEEKTHCLFNSALVNLYRNHQDSVGWHSDDEPELGDNPMIASVSLGAKRTFKLKHKNTAEKLDIPLVEGSLLIMSGETQRYWQHAVLKEKCNTAPRINITFRQLVLAQ